MTLLAEPATALARTEPLNVADLRVDRGLLHDLVVKTLFYGGRMTRNQLADELKLSGAVLQELMQSLTTDALASIVGSESTNPSGYTYALTQKGADRAESAFSRSGYVGPVPVALGDYITQARAQSVRAESSGRDSMEHALGALVLNEQTRHRVGLAAASRRPMLVYGESGNGKTSTARAIAEELGGTILIPHAIEVVGQTVKVYDPSKHERVAEPAPPNRHNGSGASSLTLSRDDRRWVRVRRPAVWAGGELTHHSLEVVYDPRSRVYEAPLQLKANGGVLIIDDFGRQQMPAVHLLNRFILALERGVDHLTLHTGQTIEVPFDVLMLFSTNLPPEQLADDAFLRRIRYKIEISSPDLAEYREIFRRECERQGVAYDDAAVRYLIENWYYAHDREFRGCHPRDLLEAICDAAAYDGRAPVLDLQAIDEACTTYFLSPDESATASRPPEPGTTP